MSSEKTSVSAPVHAVVMPFVSQHSDDEIHSMRADEIVLDCLPGNYVPTQEQAKEIAAEIINALKIKFGVKA